VFDAAECVFVYLETCTHVGSGEATKEVDQPLQREAATDYPLLPASSLKGALRGCARRQQASDILMNLLGSAPESAEKQASAVVLSDALPLLFPVRSLSGLFAWATSQDVWRRFQRDLEAFGAKLAKVPELPAFGSEVAGVAPGSPLLTTKQTLVLEEQSFPIQASAEVAALGAWLGEQALPAEALFDFWRQRLASSLVVLPEPAYRYFVRHATQVVPRIRIDPKTGTARDGSLWTEEYLPPETLLYLLVAVQAPTVAAGEAVSIDSPFGPFQGPADVLGWVRGLAPTYLQVGGGLTLGKGIARLRWTGKKPARASARKTKKA